MKILAASAVLGAKVRVEALTVEASTDFACASGIGVPGTHGPDWVPLWVSSARATGALARVRDEAVAATVASARRAVRRVRDDIGGPFARDFCV